MKLPPRDVARYVAKPDLTKAATLIYGANGMRVALKRQDLVKAIIGPEGEDEMRLTRFPAADLRKDKAAAHDAIKAVGFFPGPRAVLVEDANENSAEGVLTALTNWQPGDAHLVVTAGALKPTSKIRKAFESSQNAYAIAIYDDPPSREEIEGALAKAGVTNVSADANAALMGLATTMDPGEFSKFVEKLAIYSMGDDVSVDAIDACAPLSSEAAVDDIIHAAAEGQAAELAPILHRIVAQGITPAGICIAAMRHFRTLHTAASDPGGSAAGVGKLRPPVYGPRRDRLQRQAQHWGRARLEQAVTTLLDTDLQLRSAGQTAPQMAVMERCLIRLAMMGRR